MSEIVLELSRLCRTPMEEKQSINLQKKIDFVKFVVHQNLSNQP